MEIRYMIVVCRSPFGPRSNLRKGGEKDEKQEKGYLERAGQTAGSEVLGNDAGC